MFFEKKREAPSKFQLKICGIPNIQVAQQVVACAPDAIGIYCWTDPTLGANFSSLPEAKKIADVCKQQDVAIFYLTYSTQSAEIIEDFHAIGFTHLQLLGDIDLPEIRKIKEALPYLVIVKVIGITGKESIQEAKHYGSDPAVDQLLLDSRSGKARGGTGLTHDWKISHRIVKYTHPKAVWLAGGMRINNVVHALNTVVPYGIDLETGAQNPDGSKNYDKIAKLVELVHGAERPAVTVHKSKL